MIYQNRPPALTLAEVLADRESTSALFYARIVEYDRRAREVLKNRLTAGAVLVAAFVAVKGLGVSSWVFAPGSHAENALVVSFLLFIISMFLESIERNLGAIDTLRIERLALRNGDLRRENDIDWARELQKVLLEIESNSAVSHRITSVMLSGLTLALRWISIAVFIIGIAATVFQAIRLVIQP